MELNSSLCKLFVQNQKILQKICQHLLFSDCLKLLSSCKFLSTQFQLKIKELRSQIIDSKFRIVFKNSKKPKDSLYKVNLGKEFSKIEVLFKNARCLMAKEQQTVDFPFPAKFKDPNNFRVFYCLKAKKYMAVYRCWVDSALDFSQKEETTKDNEYHLLIEKINVQNSLGNEDAKSLFLKHKILQNELKKKEGLMNSGEIGLCSFPPLWRKFAILQFHGGDFSFAVFEDFKEVVHGSDHKYIIRKKGGGKQSTKDGQKSIKSVGSQIRRENEKALNENIDAMILENSKLLQSCNLILVYSPGMNILKLVSALQIAGVTTDKIRSIGFSSQKAKYAEILNVVKKISNVFVS